MSELSLVKQKKMEEKRPVKFLIWKFFFPMYPIRVFRSITTIMILALLLALGIILSGISIPIGFGIALGFAYLPVMVAGWFFGPVIGLIFGAICDTLSWLVHGWIWYWLYAIDEPITGLIAGVLSGILFLSQTIGRKKIWFDILANQILILGFLATSFAIVYVYTSPNSHYYQTMVANWIINPVTNRNIQILVGVFLSIFTIIIESLIWWWVIKKRSINGKRFLYASVNCVVNTALFAFILGPISAIGYYEYISGQTPKSLEQYGYMFYLLPRIVTECIQTPIYILIYNTVLAIVNPLIRRNLNRLQHGWK